MQTDGEAKAMSSRSDALGLYAGVGPELRHYEVDVEGATLTLRDAVTLPANVQYACPHPAGGVLLVATSTSASGQGPAGTDHFLSACRIDAASGALSLHGAPVRLPTRPIHMTIDAAGRRALVVFNRPSGVRVYALNDDLTPGAEVAQTFAIDGGIYAHQVRVTRDDRTAILVTRGHDATAERAEEPGALKVFDYQQGVLSNERSIAPGDGYGFGPRHLDFHPAQPWVYVSLERQNKLDMFSLATGCLSAAPQFRKDTLAAPARPTVHQFASAIRVHPDGKTVYVANRADALAADHGQHVGEGENSLVVFNLDPETGEPTAIQHIDTEGIHCRNVHIDPSGRLLAASHIRDVVVRDGAATRTVPACISLFRINADGTLDFVRRYDVALGGRLMFWMGMAAR